jgi:hypothetical protein
MILHGSIPGIYSFYVQGPKTGEKAAEKTATVIKVEIFF